MDDDGDPLRAKILQNQFLLRSSDGLIAGVCAGIAQRLETPAWAIRVFWIFAVLFGGLGLLAYLAFWISMPSDQDSTRGMRPVVLGVCNRLSQKLEIDIAILRLVAIFALVTSFGIVAIGYFIAHLILPTLTKE